MNINPEIKKILKQYNIDEDDGVLYLLAVYHNLDISLKVTDFHTHTFAIIPELVRKQVNLTKIVEREYLTEGNKLIWNVPLYSAEIVSDQWDWISEWRTLFGKLRNDAIGDKKACTIKMKRYFSEHPEVRMQDIIKATMLYLTPFYQKRQDPKYLQKADYFISKMVKDEGGITHNSRLDMYLEILKKQEGTPPDDRRINQVVK